LAWRDLAVRYKIGAAWAVIRPFLTMLVLLISGRN
jgi:ABC-type polysaccharide/polyol phosphate export permease